MELYARGKPGQEFEHVVTRKRSGQHRDASFAGRKRQGFGPPIDFGPQALEGERLDVRGQVEAKQSLAIAAAGGHGLLFVGPAGQYQEGVIAIVLGMAWGLLGVAR